MGFYKKVLNALISSLTHFIGNVLNVPPKRDFYAPVNERL